MTLQKRTHRDHHIADKSWGYEVWVENNEEYCGKELHFTTTGGSTSMHFHAKKRETMLCLIGRFEIEYIDTADASGGSVMLDAGDSVEIPRLTPHRICCLSPGVIVEFSTTHEDADSYRVGPSWQSTP